MSNIDFPGIEKVSQDEKESQERQAGSYINNLGKEEPKDSVRVLGNWITIAYRQGDKDWDPSLEYSRQYVLRTLLDLMDDPKLNSQFQGDPKWRKVHTLEILVDTYPELLERCPEEALEVAQAICKEAERLKIASFDYDEVGRYQMRETSTLSKFFEFTRTLPDKQPDEITINTFRTLFNNLERIPNYQGPMYRHLEKYFEAALREEDKNYTLFKSLFFNFLELSRTFDKKKDIHKFSAMTSIYEYLINLDKNKHVENTPELEYLDYICTLPISLRKELNQTILDRTIDSFHSEKSLSVKRDFLSVLGFATSEKRTWAQEPELIEQEIGYYIHTLQIVTTIINSYSLDNLKSDSNRDEKNLVEEAFGILASLLTQYTRGNMNDNTNWKTISEKYHPQFREALKTYLMGENLGGSIFQYHMQETIREIFDMDKLKNEKHPFRYEGQLFYQNYAAQLAKQLEKDSKKLKEEAEEAV